MASMSSRLLSHTEEGDDEDVGLFFVIPLNSNQIKCNEDMQEAYERSEKAGLEPSWKSEDDCLRVKPTKRFVFVLQHFNGPAFDYLREFRCVSITGPRCLNHCLMMEERIPIVSYPVFTVAMKDLVITCSGDTDVKKEVKEFVELMGGKYLKTLTPRTTHVVVGSVMSKKYEKALELGIPVRTCEWIGSVWKRSQKEYIMATDPSFDKFKCPPFLNMKVCSSGFIIRETEKLKSTVTNYGGSYSSSLNSQINILVVKSPKGEKFKHAKAWSIPCVEIKWIHDSVQNGHALPTKSYEFPGRAASSPTREGLDTVSFSANVSNIYFDQRTQVEETLMNFSTTSVASFCPATKVKTPNKMPPPAVRKTPVKTPVKICRETAPAPGKLKHLLQELNISQTKKAGPFLDGCGVYLIGWNSEEEENLKKILKCSGAARFSDLSESVSHVLVGNLERPFLLTLKTLHHKPHIVNIKWLIQSVADQCPAAEEPFTCLPRDDLNVSDAPSPLSKKGMALLQRENFSPLKSSPLKHAVNEEKTSSSTEGNVLLAKYISSDMPSKATLSTSLIDMPPPPVPSLKSKFTHIPDASPKGNDSDSQGDRLFGGSSFIIVGLNEVAAERVGESICEHGGVVVRKTFRGVPDYAVVPLTGATLLQTASEIITSFWIESCIEKQEIVPVEYYHQPVVLDESKKPLEGCVLGLSGFTGKERDFILELATTLGAICQDVFAKKSKGVAKASSHLICKTNEPTEKFKAAMKWGVPALFYSWLLACASSGTLMPEANHLVNARQVLKHLEISNNNSVSTATDISTSIPSKVESAQVAALKKLPCFKTPERTPCLVNQAEVDKILNYVPSPNPYSVATPPTPIGFSEDPTPRECKRVQKFLNKLPGKMPSPPPRRDSTPLHELRRKIIAAHSVTTPEMLHLVPVKEGGLPLEEDMDSPNLREVECKDSNSSYPSKDNANINCSTPTGNTSSTASRKLFDSVGEVESPIDGQLDKLQKLIATPDPDGPSAKTTAIMHSKFVGQTEKQAMYDTLKDGSQPYAIKWEDPVNVKRPLEEPSDQTIVQESNSKRKSSENDENTPDVKKPHMENTESAGKKPPKVYKISFSSAGAREPYMTIIKELGGVLIDSSSSYNPEATHLIVEKAPQRSEKLLSFIAAGKWVLHLSYLHECQKQRKFVNEEEFEWGNPLNDFITTLKPKSVETELAQAAHRWRTIIANNKSKGAFEGFCCKIYTADEKVVAFERLIAAGGGKVLPPDSSEKPSFCLVHATQKKAIMECAKLGILCVHLTFLCEHLTVNPPPKPQSRAMAEYTKLREQIASTS